MASHVFSPRAWGWSASDGAYMGPSDVLPTRVGMVRTRRWWSTCDTRSPHARGDGPSSNLIASAFRAFSPRAWGWSGTLQNPHPERPVLPTRVGMVRGLGRHGPKPSGSPHARGDGPLRKTVLALTARFSPRAWGWSGHPVPVVTYRWVLPTRVGMVRCRQQISRIRRRSPHARGDGPVDVEGARVNLKFSPRAWGWSELARNALPLE